MTLDMSPRGIATMVAKNLLLIGLVVLSAVAAAVLYLFIATNIYQARATLVVRFGSDVRPELQLDDRQIQMPSSRDERRELIESYLRIMQSRDYSRRLVEEFGIGTLYPKLLQDDGLRPAALKETAVNTLRDSIVVKSGTQTNVLELSVFHPDPTLAAKLLTRLIDMYISTQADLYENPQIAFIKTQMEAARMDLERAQGELNARRQQTGIFSFGQQFGLLLTQQDNAANNIQGLDARVAEAEGKQQRYEAILGSVPRDIAGGAEAQKYKELQDLGNEIDRLRSQGGAALQSPEFAAKEQLYQQRLREVQALNRGGTNELHEQLLTDYLRSTTDREAAGKAVDYWKGEQARIDARVQTMQDDNQAIIDMTRDVDLAEATYRALKRQYDDASVSQKLNDERITRVTVIDQPFVDAKPSRPHKFLTLVAALVGSALIAAIAVVLKEALSDRIYLPAHVEEALRLKVITSFRRFDRRALAA